MNDWEASTAAEVDRRLQGIKAWLQQLDVSAVVARGWLTEHQVTLRVEEGILGCENVRIAIAQGNAKTAVWETFQLLDLLSVLPGAPLLHPACLDFQASDRQRAAVSHKHDEEKLRAAELAMPIWWDPDRPQPEPGSTDGCELIAAQLEEAGYKRFSTKTIKDWLNEKGLIPERAKKGGRPTKP